MGSTRASPSTGVGGITRPTSDRGASRSSSKRKLNGLVKLARRRVTASFIDSVALDLLAGLDCPRSLTVALLYKYGEHQQLVDLECSPFDYCNPWSFRDAYTATELFSKSDFLDLPVDQKCQKTLEKFDAFEALCKDTNQRFRRLAFDPLYKGSNCWLLHAASSKIADILGTHVDTASLFDLGDWGPGVSTQIKGEHVSRTNKFHEERGITRDCASLVFADGWFPSQYPLWANHLKFLGGIVYEVGNRVTTVPKTAKIDRVIAIEPGLNLWFQKACGSLIRQKLKSVGVDLSANHDRFGKPAGQARNQHLCREALKRGLVTVDFSSASDSIAVELVRAIVPPDWFDCLDAFRSKYGRWNDGDDPICWEKFSSMGNGFTFELESLIFYAAAVAACEYVSVSSEDVTVYGDDVILPSVAFDVFHSFCTFLGFKVNLAKTHTRGMFRESCGVHYYGPVDCTPLYLKDRVLRTYRLFVLANRLRRLAHKRCNYYACDAAVKAAWNTTVATIPRGLRILKIPEGQGDGGLISNFDEATPARARNGIEGYRFNRVVEAPLTGEHEGVGHHLSGLFVVGRGSPSQSSGKGFGNSYPLRGRTSLRLSTRGLVSSWHDLGPWL